MKVKMTLPEEDLCKKCSSCEFPALYVFFAVFQEHSWLRTFKELYYTCICCMKVEEAALPNLTELEW